MQRSSSSPGLGEQRREGQPGVGAILRTLRLLSALTLPAILLTPAVLWSQGTVRVSGTVTDMNGLAMRETVEVRAWSFAEDELLQSGERYTGYRVRSGDSAFVDSGGVYTLDLLPGAYKLDARVGVTTGVAPCDTDQSDDTRRSCVYPAYSQANARYWLEERWHEAGGGFEDNFVQEAATLVFLEEGLPVQELNFRMRLAGAVRGRVRGVTGYSPHSPVGLVGALARVEQVSDPRRHHNSAALGDPVGEGTDRAGTFFSRGLRPTLLHRLIVHDPDGYNATYVHPATHTPSAGELFDFGTITLQPMDVDPYPTNRGPTTAVDLGRWHFDQDSPPVWTTGTNHFARIAPRNAGVVNWFCWQVRPEDRFIVTVSTLDTIPSLPGRPHPWVDPLLKVVDARDPQQPIAGTTVDRYSGPGPLDAMVDTMLIEVSATYCAVVTTAGDDDFTGTGQQSAGPYVLTIERSPNPYVSAPQLGGPFSTSCTDNVFHESPLQFVVLHDAAEEGEDFNLQIEVYRHGSSPSDSVDLEKIVPARSSETSTPVSLDISLLPDNTRYFIRVRSFDDVHHSPWSVCEFWTNIRNSLPTALVILSPDPGTFLPLNTGEVSVEVQNAYDPDHVVPGTTLDIAWCSSVDPGFGDCPSATRDWNLIPQSSVDPADTTTFVVGGLTNREAWYIKACAIDETGMCGPADETWVLVGDEDQINPVAPTGCCATAPGGHPGMALLALLGVLLLAPRRRRSSRRPAHPRCRLGSW